MKTGIYFMVCKQLINGCKNGKRGCKRDPARFSENVGPGAEAGVAEQQWLGWLSLNFRFDEPTTYSTHLTGLLGRQAKVNWNLAGSASKLGARATYFVLKFAAGDGCK